MPFLRTDNVAMFEGGDWSHYERAVSGCTPQDAQRIAVADPAITFFFYCRDSIVLTDPSWAEPKTFHLGDAVFFSGEPWWGSAPQCDGYVKQGLTIGYVDNLDQIDPIFAGQYRTAQGLNAVDVISFFAANICQSVPTGYMRLAPDVRVPAGGSLAIASDYYPARIQGCVKQLQAMGITVLITFLNNWDPAGWSAFDPSTPEGQIDAANFARQMQDVVATYGFDGIDIDDEYSTGPTYPGSLAMVTSMMRQSMLGLIISKALFQDSQYFGVPYDGVTLEQVLTYGWNMSYGLPAEEVLGPYVAAGMVRGSLSMGYQAGRSGGVEADVAWLKNNGYAGVMVYPFENPDDQMLMGEMVDDWMGPNNWNGPG